jgi:hypothetical protein
MEEAMNDELRAWLATRPPAVRDVAFRYPPGSIIAIGDRTAYVMTYREYEDGTVGLGVSFTNPSRDYDAAFASRFAVCACCLGKVHKLS